MTTDERIDALVELFTEIVYGLNVPEYEKESLLDRLNGLHQQAEEGP